MDSDLPYFIAMDKNDSSTNRPTRESNSHAERKRRFDATHDEAMALIDAEAKLRRIKTERLRELRLKDKG